MIYDTENIIHAPRYLENQLAYGVCSMNAASSMSYLLTHSAQPLALEQAILMGNLEILYTVAYKRKTSSDWTSDTLPHPTRTGISPSMVQSQAPHQGTSNESFLGIALM